MYKSTIRTVTLSGIFIVFNIFSLSASTSGSSSSTVWYLILAVIGILLLWALIYLLNYVMIGGLVKNNDAELSGSSNFSRIFGPAQSATHHGVDVHHLKKGFDISLDGEAGNKIQDVPARKSFAIKPGDFRGIAPIPKVVVAVGDKVLAGDVLFFDKGFPDIKYVSPVSGEIVEIRRGAKRAIAEVVVSADKENVYKEFDIPSKLLSKDEIIKIMLDSGLWPHINQRPYDVVPDISETPANIFISTFDSAPLAPNSNVVIAGKEAAFQTGIDILSHLTNGTVHLGLDVRKDSEESAFFEFGNCTKNAFSGPHPSGNVGIQIHHTRPISSKDKVWTLGVQDVITIGNLFLNNVYDAERVIALTGSEIEKPMLVRSYVGAKISDLLHNNNVNKNARIISGDILSGKKLDKNDYLNFKDDQITVIKEGNYYEPFGWLVSFMPRPSASKSFPDFMARSTDYTVDTNLHGEKRAFVVTGQYEKVLPMDIYPQHLMKAIMAEDFEKIEGLGVYELSEEDVALCEFVCTSKIPVQGLIRRGLDFVKEQG